MRSTAFLRPQALADLEQIFVYIAESDLDAADRFLLNFEKSVGLLADQPGLGSLPRFRKRELPGIRSWPVKGFRRVLIFYRFAEERIDIVRVLHTARDIAGIFEDRK